MGFDQLVAQVRHHAPTADGAGLLDAAAAIGAAQAADADRLLDHFVTHARGTRTPSAELPDQAGREAGTDGFTEIGTQHLLAGLLAEGVAAAILERLAVAAVLVGNASPRGVVCDRSVRQPGAGFRSGMDQDFQVPGGCSGTASSATIPK